MLGQAALLAALRHGNLHLAAGPLGQRLGDEAAFGRLMGQQDQMGRRLVVIELGEERAQHLARLERLVGAGEIGPVAPVLAGAEEEHLDGELAPLLGEAEDIGLLDALGIDALLGGDEAHRGDAVAVARRLLEIEPLRRLLHRFGKLRLHQLAAPAEKGFGLLDEDLVILPGDLAGARGRATLDLIEEARAGAILEDAVGAGADEERLLQGIDGAVDGAGRGEGSEITARQAPCTAMLGEFRNGMVAGDQDIGEGLVVAQRDIEARLELLDQIGFEQQGFRLGRGGDELHAGGHGNHRCDPVGVTTKACIARDPRLQVPRLADIKGIALAVEHAVNAGLVGQEAGKAADYRGTAGLSLGSLVRFIDGDVVRFVLWQHAGLYVGKGNGMQIGAQPD